MYHFGERRRGNFLLIEKERKNITNEWLLVRIVVSKGGFMLVGAVKDTQENYKVVYKVNQKM
ncbi:hypothetical protein BKP64_18495 [Marinobacter salinus]|uniref:Uncharacterized protein n=1 Tax=Marinobacter salinus TaxID=1874317 RepID=A0A1D9GQV6_9GAMM|nr:hypothetical protein BKP64_18495 [Marinobacter salinus]